jgi:hypothetical protein
MALMAHTFFRALQTAEESGRSARLQPLSPAGTAELSPGRSPGLDLKVRLVPQGRLKIDRNAILDDLQPSLRD